MRARSDKTMSHPHLGVPCTFSELKGKTTSSTPRSRRTITDLYATIDRCYDQIVAMDRMMNDIERLAERDYNFLLRNIRKLFGMVGDLRKQGGGGCPRCNCPRCR